MNQITVSPLFPLHLESSQNTILPPKISKPVTTFSAHLPIGENIWDILKKALITRPLSMNASRVRVLLRFFDQVGHEIT